MKKAALFIALLLILAMVMPVSAQERDPGALTESGEVSAGSFEAKEVEKGDRAPLGQVQPQASTAAKDRDPSELSEVSLIVAFDETVNPRALEAATGGKVINRYNRVFNGVSMILPEGNAAKLASMPGVKAIYPDAELQLDTDSSPGFVGAPTIWADLGRGLEAGEGVVVGVIDSGIWPEHPSFSDPDPSGNPYPAPPGAYGCEFGNTAWNANDAPFTCNNKLIGAYSFRDTYKAVYGLAPDEFDSARDADGHGTHTSSTAAGNAGVDAGVLGAEYGQVSGIAPRAHVIMYAVCAGPSGSCFASDSVAAAEQAIIDGVDVINFSIGGGGSPYSDAVSQAFFALHEAGAFVSCSAGNSGPGADTTGHREPWTITVAASTQTRSFEGYLHLEADNSDTLDVAGVSITGDFTGDVVVGADYGDALCGSADGVNPFPPGTFTPNQIVLCQRGIVARVEKSYNVMVGGGGGMILYNPALQSVVTDNHFLPSIHVDHIVGVQVVDFVATHTGVVGTIDGGNMVDAQGDVMAAFSSRGGPGQPLGISKPDITAPGVQILAGNSALPAWIPGGPDGELFQAIGGTSMSSPHVAGAGALLKDLHPDWTPGQIKSALMMTALTEGVVKEDGVTPADPFDYGSGRLDLTKAGYPSLTISDTGASFLAHEGDLWNTNYPSLYIPVMPGLQTVRRTLHNELPYKQVWRLTKTTPPDMKVRVPKYLSVPAGGNKTFKITVDARKVPLGEVRHAEIQFKRGIEVLRFPITIVRGEPAVTLDKTCDPAKFPLGGVTDCTITVQNTSLDDATVSVKDKLPGKLELIPESVSGATVIGNGVRWDGALAGAAPAIVNVAIDPMASPAGYLPLSLFSPTDVGASDESIANYTVPSFEYAGESYDTIGIVSNGYIVVGGGTAADVDYINWPLPDPTPPNNTLAPFWTDLNPGAGGRVLIETLTDGVDSWTVVEWEGVPNWGEVYTNTFQVWIGWDTDANPGEDISFVYGPDITAGGAGWLTVGAENKYGNEGGMVYFDGAGTPPSPSWPNPPSTYEVDVYSTPGAPGGSHTIMFAAEGVALGRWTNCAMMTGDIFQGTNVMCFKGKVK